MSKQTTLFAFGPKKSTILDPTNQPDRDEEIENTNHEQQNVGSNNEGNKKNYFFCKIYH